VGSARVDPNMGDLVQREHPKKLGWNRGGAMGKICSGIARFSMRLHGFFVFASRSHNTESTDTTACAKTEFDVNGHSGNPVVKRRVVTSNADAPGLK